MAAVAQELATRNPARLRVIEGGHARRGSTARRRAAMLLGAVAAVLVLFAIASAFSGGWQGRADAGADIGSAVALTRTVVVIGPGQTVWDVVLPYVPAGEDVVAYVAGVVEYNGVDATQVRPGTVLALPPR